MRASGTPRGSSEEGLPLLSCYCALLLSVGPPAVSRAAVVVHKTGKDLLNDSWCNKVRLDGVTGSQHGYTRIASLIAD